MNKVSVPRDYEKEIDELHEKIKYLETKNFDLQTNLEMYKHLIKDYERTIVELFYEIGRY